MTKLTEMKKLQEENDKIRCLIQKGFNTLLKGKNTKSMFEKVLWDKINELIENELSQEALCGE